MTDFPRSFATWLALVCVPFVASAQGTAIDKLNDHPEHVADSNIGFRRGSVIAAPIPLSNPTIGSGLILGAGYMFQADESSDTSFLGVAGMGTDNGSRAAGAAINLHFGDNRWNIQLLGGAAEVNYDLYGFGSDRHGPIAIEQDGTFARVKLTYGLTNSISAGIDATFLETEISTPTLQELLDPVLPDFGVRISQVTFGPSLSFDTVDDTIYPTRGVNLTYTGQKGTGLEGSRADFWKNILIGTGYAPLGERVVVAGKVTACTIGDRAPFFNLCTLGGTDGFRGYPVGEYLDHALASAQGAVRLHGGKRLGGAVFGGVGAVASDFSALSDAKTLYAGGVGVRFRLSRKFPLDFAVDQAWNEDGETTTYVRVGQAF